MTHNLYWPLFDLRIETSKVSLLVPNDEQVVELAALGAKGVHDPDVMPFANAWTRLPSPELERGALRHHWSSRAEFEPNSWSLVFAVVVDGEIVGSQDLRAKDLAELGVVSTGSWLTQRVQGRGIGKEMRAAVLNFAFDCLGAIEARSAANSDNVASIKVSRALGYEDNGYDVQFMEDKRVISKNFVLTRERWADFSGHYEKPVVAGFEACRSMFGVA